ncbi:MAG: type II secretion system protein [Phycisphaeraceae bacterium]
MRHRPHPHAFSLIELLVLIGIVGVLTAVLMPAMASVRATARADECAGELRRIGQAWETFAFDHDGRGPGVAENPGGSTPHSWGSWLNHFIWGDEIETFAELMAPIQKFNGWAPDHDFDQWEVGPGEGNIVCPSIGQWDEPQFARPYIANANATGGVAFSDRPYEYGKLIRDHPFDQHANAYLGTRLDAFRRPGMRFMVFEADRANDSDRFRSNERDAVAEIDPENPTTRSAGGIGTYMFRHPGLTMNALMMDGRVRRLANDPAQFEVERFQLR